MRSSPDGTEALVVPSVPQSVSRIRGYAAEACAARGWGGDYDTVSLLVSEVATNALVHGTGEVQVRVCGEGPLLRVEVADDSPTVPVKQAARPDAEGGRGMALVDALADVWGIDARPDGKTVWFELGV